MSTTIGTVTLDQDMYFSDLLKRSKVNASVTPTLGGGAVVQEFSKLDVGRLITLTTKDGMGYQLKATLDSLQALADSAGSTYTLTIVPYVGANYVKTVRFRNEIDGGAIQMEPASLALEGIPRDTVWYEGSIFLMVVA